LLYNGHLDFTSDRLALLAFSVHLCMNSYMALDIHAVTPRDFR